MDLSPSARQCGGRSESIPRSTDPSSWYTSPDGKGGGMRKRVECVGG